MIHGQFVLVTDEPLSAEELTALRYVLSDALLDFRRAREFGNAEEYVDKRYGPRGSESWVSWGSTEEGQLAAYDRKVEEVRSRLRLAHVLHNAAVGARVKVVPDLHDWMEAEVDNAEAT
jgi:hypothetical protein